jgi:hypothetical protein
MFSRRTTLFWRHDNEIGNAYGSTLIRMLLGSDFNKSLKSKAFTVMETLFTPGCPCCAEELGAGGVPAAPSEPRRHSESAPKEFLRKELTQCQYCYKSKNSGITLQKCAACLIDVYCVC